MKDKKMENSQRLQWACFYAIIATLTGFILIWLITGVMLTEWLTASLSAFTAILLGLIGKNAYDNSWKIRSGTTYDYYNDYREEYK